MDTYQIISVEIIDGNTLNQRWRSPMQKITTDKGEFIDNEPLKQFGKNSPGFDWKSKIGQTVQAKIVINSNQKWLSIESNEAKKTKKPVVPTDPTAVSDLEAECQQLFSELTALQRKIHEKLSGHADGKNLKGNELVGWLGEIYGKLLFDGTLVDDREEHDFVSSDALRVSVKTRKGWKGGWKNTSAIPQIEGEGCPTHLLFVHLNDDYSLDRIWLLEWCQLVNTERFKKHVVRGSQRSFIFSIDEKKDSAYVVYSKTANLADHQ